MDYFGRRWLILTIRRWAKIMSSNTGDFEIKLEIVELSDQPETNRYFGQNNKHIKHVN